PSFILSVRPALIRPPVRPSTSVRPAVRLPPSARPSVYLRPSVRPSTSVHPSVRLPPSVCPSVRQSVRQSVLLSFINTLQSPGMAKDQPRLPGVLAYITDQIKQRLLTGYAADTIFAELQRVLRSRGNCVEIDGLFFVANRVVIPADPVLRLQLIMAAHDKSGHLGFPQTMSRLRGGYFWPGIGDDVKMFIHTCPTCHHKDARQASPSATTLGPSETTAGFLSTTAPLELPTGLLPPPAKSSLPSGLSNSTQRPNQIFPEQRASTPDICMRHTVSPKPSSITPTRAPHPGPRVAPPAPTLIDLSGQRSHPDKGVWHPRPHPSPLPLPTAPSTTPTSYSPALSTHPATVSTSSPSLSTHPTTASTQHCPVPPPALVHTDSREPLFPAQWDKERSGRPSDQTANRYEARIRHLEMVVRVLLARTNSIEPLYRGASHSRRTSTPPLAGSFRYSMDQGLQPVLSKKRLSSQEIDRQERRPRRSTTPVSLPGLSASLNPRLPPGDQSIEANKIVDALRPYSGHIVPHFPPATTSAPPSRPANVARWPDQLSLPSDTLSTPPTPLQSTQSAASPPSLTRPSTASQTFFLAASSVASPPSLTRPSTASDISSPATPKALPGRHGTVDPSNLHWPSPALAAPPQLSLPHPPSLYTHLPLATCDDSPFTSRSRENLLVSNAIFSPQLSRRC
ncbi:hypothetical protein PTTG_30192, partial [Puccinia triticina 1-1 BBBD Race 1]